ncbi:MAG TPA: hypothetical protein VD969_17300 [Symbiobacteriaceae bacterium]|nr:hypothetical protein [Symbiobacteriaceae bacterium]
MPRKDPVGSPLASLVPILQAVGGLSLSGYAWAVFDPTGFSAMAAAIVPACRLIGAGCITGGFAYAWWKSRRRPLTPTHEDWACGTYITGLPGSGKTAFAYLLAHEFCQRGWGWIWISIKSSLPLLSYLPPEAQGRCLLFAPYSDHPLGINFLRTYTNSSTERELIADQAAELFERLHSAMSGNMRELIRMGTLALLLWADHQRIEVTLWELYRFFQEEAFRGKVLATAPKPVRDAFGSDEIRRQTLQAVRAQLRRAVASENLLVALSQQDGIDLWRVMNEERFLVCDTPEALLGPAVAGFLCTVIASRVQMLTSRRPVASRPFGCFNDEFQEYSNPSFAKGIATGREFGLAWVLIHQSRANQAIGKEVSGAVHLCGNRYYFQQTPEDARAALEATEERWEKSEFTHLPKRHYRALRRIHGQPVVTDGVTPDLPAPDPDLAAAVIERSQTGPTRVEILAAIQKRKVVGRNDDHNREGTPAAAGTV